MIVIVVVIGDRRPRWQRGETQDKAEDRPP
jgi:hypothetical protein